MKKWIIRILVAVLVLGTFAAVGFVGYRLGFAHGARVTRDGNRLPPIARFERGGPEWIPGQGIDHSFQRDLPRGGFVMRHRGGFGIFPPLISLAHVIFLGFVIWLAYMLFKGNGWQLSLTRVAAPQTPPVMNQSEATAAKKPGKGKR